MIECPVCKSPLIYKNGQDHYCFKCKYGVGPGVIIGAVGDGFEVIKFSFEHKTTKEAGFIYKIVGEKYALIVGEYDIEHGSVTEEDAMIRLAEMSLEHEKTEG